MRGMRIPDTRAGAREPPELGRQRGKSLLLCSSKRQGYEEMRLGSDSISKRKRHPKNMTIFMSMFNDVVQAEITRQTEDSVNIESDLVRERLLHLQDTVYPDFPTEGKFDFLG